MKSLDFSFPNKLSELESCRSKISEFMNNEVDPKIKNRIILSLDETISNIIEHGFPENTDSLIQVKAELNLSEIKFTLIDSGIEFNPLEKKAVDIDEHLAMGEDGGIGIHIVQKIMDMKYQRDQNKNILILKKNLKEKIEP